MDTIFMNSKNSKTSDPHRLLINLLDKINVTRERINMLLHQTLTYTWKSIKKLYKNNKFKISAATWSEEFELHDGLYSESDIRDYFE